MHTVLFAPKKTSLQTLEHCLSLHGSASVLGTSSELFLHVCSIIADGVCVDDLPVPERAKVLALSSPDTTKFKVSTGYIQLSCPQDIAPFQCLSFVPIMTLII